VTYLDSLAVATWMALDTETPDTLLPLVVANQAAMLRGCDTDRVRPVYLR